MRIVIATAIVGVSLLSMKVSQTRKGNPVIRPGVLGGWVLAFITRFMVVLDRPLMGEGVR
jgi:hypothetical protein